MANKGYGDTYIKPIKFPDELEVYYRERDKETHVLTGQSFRVPGLFTLAQLKGRLPIYAYKWPEYETQLAVGETVCVATDSFPLSEVSA